MTNAHERFMQVALEEVRRGAAEGNAAVGSVVVCDGKIIARGRNLVVTQRHALDGLGRGVLVWLRRRGGRSRTRWRRNDPQPGSGCNVVALAGVAVAMSEGEGGFRDHEAADDEGRGSSTLSSTLTTVHPYARLSLIERLSVWGILSYRAARPHVLVAGIVDEIELRRVGTLSACPASPANPAFLRRCTWQRRKRRAARMGGATLPGTLAVVPLGNRRGGEHICFDSAKRLRSSRRFLRASARRNGGHRERRGSRAACEFRWGPTREERRT